MATAKKPSQTLSESAYGRVTDDTMKKYPALSYLTAKKAAQEAGMDPSDPVSVRGAMRSNAVKDNVSKLSGRADQRTIERITNMKVDLPNFDAKPEDLERAGYDAKSTAINATTRGRQAVFRQFLDQQTKLDEMAGLDAEINRKEKLLEYQATEPIDREIAETKNQMITARSTLLAELSGLSPTQQNAILAKQNSFFQTRLDNLEVYRKARLKAVESEIDEETATSTRQKESIEARIKGLEKTIKFIEDSAGDLDAAADLRIKLAQERKKLGKGKSKDPDRKTILKNAAIEEYERQFGPATSEVIQSIDRRVESALASEKQPGWRPVVGGPLYPISELAPSAPPLSQIPTSVRESMFITEEDE